MLLAHSVRGGIDGIGVLCGRSGVACLLRRGVWVACFAVGPLCRESCDVVGGVCPRADRAGRHTVGCVMYLVASCMAVGSSSGAGPIAEQWNGTRWTLTPTASIGFDPAGATLDAVSCSSADACTAVGGDQAGDPLIERWNGRQWSRQASSFDLTSLAPSSVSCGSATACVTVASDLICGEATCYTAYEVQRWDGRKWRRQRIRTSGSWADFSLNSMSCASANACMIVGYFERGGGCPGGSGNSQSCDQLPLVERWNGRRWQRQNAPKLPGETLDGVSCPSRTGCTVVGTFSQHRRTVLFAARWNGARWKIRRVPATRGFRHSALEGWSCASARDCIALLTRGARAWLTVHWNGRRWQLAQVGVPLGVSHVSVSGVSCEPKGSCLVVGGFVNATGQPATLVERLQRSRWSVQPSANHMTDINALLNGVSCASDTFCLAVGALNVNPGMPLVEQWDGSAWAIQTLPADSISNSFNGGCPRSRRNLNGGPPVPSAPVGSVRGD